MHDTSGAVTNKYAILSEMKQPFDDLYWKVEMLRILLSMIPVDCRVPQKPGLSMVVSNGFSNPADIGEALAMHKRQVKMRQQAAKKRWSSVARKLPRIFRTNRLVKSPKELKTLIEEDIMLTHPYWEIEPNGTLVTLSRRAFPHGRDQMMITFTRTDDHDGVMMYLCLQQNWIVLSPS